MLTLSASCKFKRKKPRFLQQEEEGTHEDIHFVLVLWSPYQLVHEETGIKVRHLAGMYWGKRGSYGVLADLSEPYDEA
jgi:hypothetical protein